MIKSLKLSNFKLFKEFEYEFKTGITVFSGKNASGKSSILEAVSLLSSNTNFLKNSKNYIKFGEEMGYVQGSFKSGEINKIIQFNKEGETTKARTSTNANEISTLKSSKAYSEPIILFSHQDFFIVSGEPKNRRSYIDEVLSFLNPKWNSELSKYNKLLLAKSKLLKSYFESEDKDSIYSQIQYYNSLIIPLFTLITNSRLETIEEINKHISSTYSSISNTKTTVFLKYLMSEKFILDNGKLKDETVEKIFDEYLERECLIGTNLFGPQKDDIEIIIDGENSKTTSSLGEIWTLAFSLKMVISSIKNSTDFIVILDDLFSFLDDDRSDKVLDYLTSFPQTLISTTKILDKDNIEIVSL